MLGMDLSSIMRFLDCQNMNRGIIFDATRRNFIFKSKGSLDPIVETINFWLTISNRQFWMLARVFWNHELGHGTKQLGRACRGHSTNFSSFSRLLYHSRLSQHIAYNWSSCTRRNGKGVCAHSIEYQPIPDAQLRQFTILDNYNTIWSNHATLVTTGGCGLPSLRDKRFSTQYHVLEDSLDAVWYSIFSHNAALAVVVVVFASWLCCCCCYLVYATHQHGTGLNKVSSWLCNDRDPLFLKVL